MAGTDCMLGSRALMQLRRNSISSSVGTQSRTWDRIPAYRGSSAYLICSRRITAAFKGLQRWCLTPNFALSTYRSGYMTAGNCKKSPKKMIFTPANEISGLDLAVPSWLCSYSITQQSNMEISSITYLLMFLPRFQLGKCQLVLPLHVR
jgi:hypothetical protein